MNNKALVNTASLLADYILNLNALGVQTSAKTDGPPPFYM